MNRLRSCRVVGLASLLSFLSVDVPACRLTADPILSVTGNGTANGNQLWLVEVAPDPSLFSNTPEGLGGSLAVELDFRTDSEIVSVTKNAAAWPNDNAGFNPFTEQLDFGVTFDANTAFVALGSDLFTAGDAVEVVTIETRGAGLGTLSWGGNLAFPDDAEPYDTSRIAQAGMNFDGFTGMVTVAASLAGDYNGNGQVEQGDLDLVLLNWGANVTANPPPDTWINQRPTAGFIDQAELDGVLLNWGDIALGATAVPEPATLVLLLLCGGLFAVFARRAC